MIYQIEPGHLVDFSESELPCQAWSHRDEQEYKDESSTYYGYCRDGMRLICNSGSFWLNPGMYFATPGPMKLCRGLGVLIERQGFRGLFSIGGPIEKAGRLRYIDGCTDTLLIGPPKCGDPCLNHLHFPANIRQTMHTHPSVRIGIVANGSGRCVTPLGESPLLPGVVWYLPVDGQHCFYTDQESMDIIAWHPDSDTGPKDEDHPMINRTYVNDVSARFIDSIRTA